MQDAAQRIQNPEFRIQKMEVRVCFSYLLDSGYWLLESMDCLRLRTLYWIVR